MIKKKVNVRRPFLDLATAESIAAEFPTPIHVYDEAGIRANARRLHEAMAWNKGFKEYFAVKATPNPYILNLLKEEGCGVDCSSYTELQMAAAVGFRGEDIMFSSNVTPAEDYLLAAELGATINLDDYTHIDFLAATLGRIPKRISCRFNPGGHFVIGNEIMDNPGEAKYGFTLEQLIDGYRKLKELGAEEFGIHSFLVSNSTSDEYYPALAELLCRTAIQVREETGVEISFINLSGGIGIPYRPEQEEVDIFKVGREVQAAFESILGAAGFGEVALNTELGRYMLAPYGCLLTRVLHLKHIHKEYVGVDACAANLMRPAMYGAYHHITVLGKEDAPLDHVYDVTGGLCENNDKFAINRELPQIVPGDLLVIHDTGAHGFAMGYNYNGRLRSAELLLREDGSLQLIRRAETSADYFATLDWPGLPLR